MLIREWTPQKEFKHNWEQNLDENFIEQVTSEKYLGTLM